MTIRRILISALIAALAASQAAAPALAAMPPSAGPQPRPAIPQEPYSTLLRDAAAGRVRRVVIDQAAGTITVTGRDHRTAQVSAPIDTAALAQTLTADHVTVTYGVVAAPGDNSPLALLAVGMAIAGLAIGLALLSRRRTRRRTELPPAGTRSRADAREPVCFADVAGCDEAVEELRDVLAFLTAPERLEALGARPPAGILLHGEPGTGKTLLARALAGEAGVPFFPASGSDFVEMYVGVGARRVRELFARARRSETGAVVFIDEIDAIGRRRSQTPTGGNQEAENTLNALLR